MSVASNRVLIVDDQLAIHDDFREMLDARHPSETDTLAAAFLSESPADVRTFELLHASSGAEAVAAVQEAAAAGEPIALAFVDIRMPPGMDGVATLRQIRAVDPGIEFVIMTAYADRSLPEITEGIAPAHKLLYVRKPFSREEIQQLAVALVEKYNVEHQLAAHEQALTASHGRLEAILGATDEAIALFDRSGELAFANRRFEELCGAAPGDLVGKSGHACQPQLRPLRPADLEHATAFGPDDDLREFADGDRRYVFQRTEKDVDDGNDRPIGRLHVYRDVSVHIDKERMDAEMRHLRLELASAHAFSGIIGASRPMREMFALMERAARGGISVLVRGESGTGKELVAKALHFNGPRKAQRLEVVNCAALPDNLVESELFGHERGAFTGAVGRRIGAFERADGGSIFLDEIGDMKPDLQAKLLRVLQEREVHRLGGREPRSIDVQVIAASNQDLEQAMQDGTFRPDLYYRIAGLSITVPPLRDRAEDIPLLATHFLDRAKERAEQDLAGFAPGAMARLMAYPWPGNVRELESAVERAALLSSSGQLDAEALLPMSPAAAGGHPPPTLDGDLVLPLDETVRRAVVRALSRADHNITHAARTLGIHRTTLSRMVKRLGIALEPEADG